MEISLKTALADRLRQAGAYETRVADPHKGFEHAIEGKHPLDLWHDCKSVVVFAIPMSPFVNNTYMGPFAPFDGDRNVGPVPSNLQSSEYALARISRLFRSSVTLKGMTLLSEKGYEVSFAIGQDKLCAYEAGLGVYGRSGVILNPNLGNRMILGTILTDAPLEADAPLQGFNPCENCDICIKACPAKAYDPEKTYPHSWTREICMSKRAKIVEKGLFCHNCFASCPAGKSQDEELFLTREAGSFYSPKKERL